MTTRLPNVCETCGAKTDLHTGGPPLTEAEQAEVAAFHASFNAPDGSHIWHTGHMPDRLLRLPMHWYCETHLPKWVRQ